MTALVTRTTERVEVEPLRLSERVTVRFAHMRLGYWLATAYAVVGRPRRSEAIATGEGPSPETALADLHVRLRELHDVLGEVRS